MIFVEDHIDDNLYDPPFFVKLKCREEEVNFEGVECVFIPLNTRHALKAYPSRELCKEAVGRQKAAAKHKVGPPVCNNGAIQKVMVPAKYVKRLIGCSAACWNRRRLQNHGYVILWAYKTAIAKKAPKGSEYENTLCERLRKAGLSRRDLHPANIGIYKGQVVKIDFGKLSS